MACSESLFEPNLAYMDNIGRTMREMTPPIKTRDEMNKELHR